MKRRTFSRLIGWSLIVLLPISALSQACMAAVPVYTATFFDVFDTVTTITGTASSRASFDDLCASIHQQLTEYHRLLDIYHTYEGMSNLKTLNDQAGTGTPVALDDCVLDVLEWGQSIEAMSAGKVNILLGPVLRLWDGYRAQGHACPTEEELSSAMEKVRRATLIIDRAGGTAQISEAGASVDVGAIAKGYVSQQVAAQCLERGVTSLLLNIGGNVCAIGAHPLGTPWQVGVQDVDGQGAVLNGKVTDAWVVTSGDYQRYYEVDGVRYHHLIDPDSGTPASLYRAVTVVMPLENGGFSDALSTALFFLDEEDGRALLAHFPHAAALWIRSDGSMTASEEWTHIMGEAAL